MKHFNVQIHNGVYHLHDKCFFSILELCSFYSRHDVPNAEGYKDIRLLHPIQNPIYKPKRQALPEPPRTVVQCPHSADSVNTSLPVRDLRRTKTCSNLKSQTLSTQNRDLWFPICNYKNMEGRSHEKLPGGFEDCNVNSKLEIRNNSRELWFPPKERLTSFKVQMESTTTTTTIEHFKDQPTYYSSVRKREDNVLEDVLEQLRMMEDVDKCSCGLPLSETELYDGWSVHLSTEPITLGMVFYTSPSGNTSWKLPSKISRRLTPSQKDFIKLLKQKKSSAMNR